VQTAMKSALIFAQVPSVCLRLQEHLGQAGYAVDHVQSPGEVYSLLRHDERTVLIAEARRDCFSSLLRNVLNLRPELCVYLFQAGSIFCFYPFRSQPPDLLEAFSKAGILISDPFRRVTNPSRSAPETIELVE
jgi:hypothetical protein